MARKYSLLIWTAVVWIISVKGQSVQYLQENKHAGFKEQELNFCPCSDERICAEHFDIPVVDQVTSRNWFVVKSNEFRKIKVWKPECTKNQMEIILNEDSFVLLPSGDLLHVHGKLIIPHSEFCFKRSLSEDYTQQQKIEESKTYYLKLEADVCLSPPEVSYCCQRGEVIVKHNNTAKCKPENAPPFSPIITFDGSIHKWPVTGSVSEFPMCNKSMSFVPIVDAIGFGSLQYISKGLEFRWQPTKKHKLIKVNHYNYCIGQLSSYGSIKPAVAFCRPDVNDLCGNKKACFGKCCPEEAVFDMDSQRCQTTNFKETWSLDENVGDFSLVYGMPSCESYFDVSADQSEYDHFQMISNGSIFINSWNDSVSVPNYCFDYFRNHTHLIPLALTCLQTRSEDTEIKSIDPTLYSALLLSSSVQLILALIYFLAKSLSRMHKRYDALYLILVSSYMIASAGAALMIGLQQLLYSSLSAVLCIVLARLAEAMAVAAVAGLLGLVLHNWLITRTLHQSDVTKRCWETAIVVGPWLVGAAVAGAVEATSIPLGSRCPVDAALTDPWVDYPSTIASSVILIACVTLLFITRETATSSSGQRLDTTDLTTYTDVTMRHSASPSFQPTVTTSQTQSPQTAGYSGYLDYRSDHGVSYNQKVVDKHNVLDDHSVPDERQISYGNNVFAENTNVHQYKDTLDHGGTKDQKTSVGEGIPIGEFTAPEREICADELCDRWWLAAKLVVTNVVFYVCYYSVWEAGSLAFWVFGDLVLVLRSLVVTVSLLRPVTRCPSRVRLTS